VRCRPDKGLLCGRAQPPVQTNFYQDDGLANGFDDGYAVTGSTTNVATQNYLTDVGAYASSPSYYGTFDQGGNVARMDRNASQRDLQDCTWRFGIRFCERLGGLTSSSAPFQSN
jgi:hypothetical protein